MLVKWFVLIVIICGVDEVLVVLFLALLFLNESLRLNLLKAVTDKLIWLIKLSPGTLWMADGG